MLLQTNKVRKIITCFSLIPLYLLWVSSAMGLPLLSMVKGNSHEISFSYSHGTFHLHLNHDENPHLQESPFIDTSEVASEHQNHSSDPNHEIHVSSLVQHRAVATATKTSFYSSLPSVLVVGAIPGFFNPPLNKFPTPFFYQINSNPFHLHKIVLLV